jgi:glycosyltransferase involved in cell wall biosynthesis
VISFILPAYNEEALLPGTLATLFASARALGRPFEVIVADDASTDRTAEIAAAAGARVVAVNHRQISATRNAGARAAQGDILVFIDADTLVPEATLRAVLAACDEDGAVAGGARVAFDRIPLGHRLFWGAYCRVYHGLGFAAGCFIFARREAFAAAGGFDETLYASEEAGMSWRLRKQGRFVIVRPPVTTSGRKLRMYRAREILAVFLRFARRGFGAFRTREGLGIWYDGRREGGEAP